MKDTIKWSDIVDGREAAYNALYDRYADLLYGYGMKIVADEAVVMDAMQTLFMNIFEKRKSLSAPNSMAAYLCRSLKNLLINEMQSASSKYTCKINDADAADYDFDLQPDIENALIAGEEENEKLRIFKEELSKLSRQQRDAYLYAKKKVEAAQGFIDAIHQRQRTLMSVMQVIVDLQHPFFEDGDEARIRPMILKDVADRAGVDISTVSRVTGSKYVQTDFGVYPLKFFFSNALTTDEGEEHSTRKIKLLLREMIEHEDKRHPLTDESLSAMLAEKGLPVARRTVAKYREQLGLPVARLRR